LYPHNHKVPSDLIAAPDSPVPDICVQDPVKKLDKSVILLLTTLVLRHTVLSFFKARIPYPASLADIFFQPLNGVAG
jgi:hypothetical protein